MPSRHPEAASLAERDGRWSRDMKAYKDMRKQGVQPRGIDGAHDLAMRAESQVEVESGQVLDKTQRAALAEAMSPE